MTMITSRKLNDNQQKTK